MRKKHEATAATLSPTLALAQRYGMDPEMLREALETSSADNYVLRNWRVNTMAWAEDDMEIVQQLDEYGV
jgi:3-hydroxyisobutyrate dehydrogenase